MKGLGRDQSRDSKHSRNNMKKVTFLLAVGLMCLAACAQKKGGVGSASWSAKLPSSEQEKLAEELISRGGNVNFIKWEAGSVLPETGRAMEHMASFDYGYKIAAVRDWLFMQCKE